MLYFKFLRFYGNSFLGRRLIFDNSVKVNSLEFLNMKLY